MSTGPLPFQAFRTESKFTTMAHRPASPDLNSPRRASPCRVLIVEFREEISASLKSLFEKPGCDVVGVSSGSEVAAEVRKFSPDLIVLSERMPGESGWLMACKLRLGRLPQPIWLYTHQPPQKRNAWQDFSGIDHVLFYDGQLAQLHSRLQQRLQPWLKDFDSRQASRAG